MNILFFSYHSVNINYGCQPIASKSYLVSTVKEINQTNESEETTTRIPTETELDQKHTERRTKS